MQVQQPIIMAPKRKAASASASKDLPDAPSSKRKKTEAPVKDSIPVRKWDCILLLWSVLSRF